MKAYRGTGYRVMAGLLLMLGLEYTDP